MTLLSLTENEQCLKENFLKQILPEWTKETKTYYKIKRAFFTTKTSINQAEKKKKRSASTFSRKRKKTLEEDSRALEDNPKE